MKIAQAFNKAVASGRLKVLPTIITVVQETFSKGILIIIRFRKNFTIRSDYDSIKVKEIVANTYELECTFRMDLKPLWTTLLDVDIQ